MKNYKALCVGIDFYETGRCLHGCVADAMSVDAVLSRNEDQTVNFATELLIATDEDTPVKRTQLLENIETLFSDAPDIALLYFAGHGSLTTTGGHIVASDTSGGNGLLNLSEILTIVTNSKARNKIIILDSCNSGAMGNSPTSPNIDTIGEGITILTACGANQYASEENGHGVFTDLLVDALKGGAMDLLGNVTPGSVYAHIDQALGPWEQRPFFKTNVSSFVSLRKNTPPISLTELHQLTSLFPYAEYEFPLDPSYEPESKKPSKENTEKFAILQNYVRVNLVVPVDEKHMYFAAMNKKACKLTALGKHYRNLVNNGRI